MTVERVRITPTQITLKDSSNKVVFDTSNQYIRTETNGNLRLNTQMPAIRFTTFGSVVRATNKQGVILGYRKLIDISQGGQRPSFRFPEFSGTLAIAVSQFSEGGGQPVFVGFFGCRVAINGVFTPANIGAYGYPLSRSMVFNPQGGGGGLVAGILDPPTWEWTNIAPGTLITLGPVYRASNSDLSIVTEEPVNSNYPGSARSIITVMAFQNQISSLPLTVTP